MSHPPPTLFEWAGGQPALDRLFTHFYAAVREDGLIGPVFAHMDPHHATFVAAFVAEVFGGPNAYTTGRGGHPHMIRAHVEKRLNEAQRRRWFDLLLSSADAVGLPVDPEFRSAFVSYLEWGSRLAVINSQAGAPVQYHDPMPSWNWGVVGGPFVDPGVPEEGAP